MKTLIIIMVLLTSGCQGVDRLLNGSSGDSSYVSNPSVNPTGPSNPTEPSEPTEPTEPTGPTEPSEPSEPSEPLGSRAPVYLIMGQSNSYYVGLYNESYMETELTAFHGEPINVINCAVGGTPLTRWEPTGDLYQACKDRLDINKQYVAGILFWQGEWECQDESQSNGVEAQTWGQRFAQTISKIKQETFSAQAKVMWVRIGLHRDSIKAPYTNTVRLQQEICLVNGKMLDVDPPILNDTGWHYDLESYKKVADTFLAYVK